MTGKFSWQPFYFIELADPIFNSLKEDYPHTDTQIGFINWFQKKSLQNEKALIFQDEIGIGAFMYLKDEGNENRQEIKLNEKILTEIDRVKIGTLKLADRYQGQRLGEGALGYALWLWQKEKYPEIYITVFSKHKLLINMLEQYGFTKEGTILNSDECLYIKRRNNLDYSNAYKYFPYINPNFKESGFLIINDYYHDTLFPYSEVKGTLQKALDMSVRNGYTKVYIGSSWKKPHYKIGDPILVYRKYTKNDGQKPRYKSVITSYCTVTDIYIVKSDGKSIIALADFINKIHNKSQFTKQELIDKYKNEKNLNVIEVLYNGYFGAGHNINYDWLINNGYFKDNEYPADTVITKEQFISILKRGAVDAENVIID